MGWSVGDYQATPIVLLNEIEFCIALERRHQAAEQQREWAEHGDVP